MFCQVKESASKVKVHQAAIFISKSLSSPIHSLLSKVPIFVATRPNVNWTFLTPSCTGIESYCIAPGVGRIAWILPTEHRDVLAPWINRLHIGRPRPGKIAVNAVWVSDLFGNRWRRLGEMPVRQGDDPSTMSICNLHWLPSGKKLSFEYEDVLYTIPAG